MKREDLEKLGLSEEQINSVMAEHGKTVNSLNAKLSTAEESVKALNGQIAARDKDIKDLKKSATDNEDLSQRYTDLEKRYKQEKADFDKKIADAKLDHAIDMSLVGKVHDSSIVRGLLDRTKLTLDDAGNLTGIDEQLKPLQESKGFLFIQEDSTPPGASRFVGDDIEKGTGTGTGQKSRAELLAEQANINSQSSGAFDPWANN